MKSITCQLLNGLSELHGMSLYHRDIKEANVSAKKQDDGNWKLRIIDVGLVADMNDPIDRAENTHHLSGTPPYMDSNALNKRKDLDEKELASLV